jgi:hypothetical protein
MLTCDVSINFFYTSCVDNDEYKIYMLEIFHRSNRMRLLPIISKKNFANPTICRGGPATENFVCIESTEISEFEVDVI